MPPSDAEYCCEKCGRTFERPDHYARHLQSHGDRRPYRCPICPKAFNRGDLLHRHKQTHLRNNGSPQTGRVSRACQACIRSKAKCTDKRPCQRCVNRGELCLPSAREAESAADSWDPTSHAILTADTRPSPPARDEHFIAPSPPPTGDLHEKLEHQQSIIVDEDNDLTGDYLASPSANGFSFTDAFTSDAGKGCLEPDVDSMQVFMESIYSDAIVPGRRMTPSPSRLETSNLSPWLWMPVYSNNPCFERDLRANGNNMNFTPCESQQRLFTTMFSPEFVTRSDRDRMLFMIYSTSHSSVPLQAFPSKRSLYSMLQAFLGCQKYDPVAWIHPTFILSTEYSIELLSTFIGAGASLTSVPSICRMGYALQECSRLSLSASIEKDGSRVRELQTIQVYLLCASMGLWSGFKRNMEAAETFLSTPITILRRYGYFSLAPYAKSIHPPLNDDATTREARWRVLVKRESLKRAAIFAILTDLGYSMAYLRSPTCSVTELSSPLPVSWEIWQSNYQDTWRDLILSYGTSPHQSYPWLAMSQNPALLESLPVYYDKPLIALVATYAFWPQVWAFRESQRFFRTHSQMPGQATTTLWLSCQHDDLNKRIDSTQKSLSSQVADSTYLDIVAEFCKMALNVSLQELQRFAKRVGEEAEIADNDPLREWMAGPESKAAVWHAGQIFQNARTAPTAQLRDFYAVAVYQASLTLWAYGVLSLTMGQTPTIETEDACRVILDGPSTSDSTAFVMFGKGVPGIIVGSDWVFSPLTDIRSAMTAGCDVYRGNFSSEMVVFPPLLEGLMKLMTRLGNIDTASL